MGTTTLLIVVGALAFAAGPLRSVPFGGFVEAFCSALIAVNIVTAVLLWRHAVRAERASLAALSAGFSFVAMTALVYMLADMHVLFPAKASAALGSQ
ncbi:MAG TPA: hypothetical protein VGD50_05770, partial [Candidatus Baltobacteraceae bacterium]